MKETVPARVRPEWALISKAGSETRANRLRVAVLYGGTSSEREVSLVSGRAMVEALGDAGECTPLSVTAIEIGADGLWHLDSQHLPPGQAVENLASETVFMIGLHGGEGEGGAIQGFLQVIGRAFTGTGHAASALCLDKIRSRQVFAQAGLRIAPGLEVWPQDVHFDPTATVARILALGPGPWFLKPSLGGSSVSMGHAKTEQDLLAYLSALPELDLGEGLLVEQCILGVEVTVGVVAGPNNRPICLPVVEIQPGDSGWFDHEEKYSPQGALEWCPPKNVTEKQQHQVQLATQRAWQAIGLSSYARIDFIIDEAGDPVLLEANTLPGFTPRSLLPMAAGVAGLSFDELCVELCLRAEEDLRSRQVRGDAL
ncbi:MAG: hypothetical protein GY930_18770 [bacterium]|nr:hypothetical protein [bacterium]